MKKGFIYFCVLMAVVSFVACGKSDEAMVNDISTSYVEEESAKEDNTVDLENREEEVGVDMDLEEENPKTQNPDTNPDTNPDITEDDNKNMEDSANSNADTITETTPESINLKLIIDGTQIPVTWEDNAAIEEMKEQVKQGDIVVAMSPYGGFEQVGSLGRSYTRNDAQTTTSFGDIVLYGGNQIVVFYGSNSWSYTRLGKMGISEDEAKNLLSGSAVSLRITR